jgi:hypothetical protein
MPMMAMMIFLNARRRDFSSGVRRCNSTSSPPTSTVLTGSCNLTNPPSSVGMPTASDRKTASISVPVVDAIC